MEIKTYRKNFFWLVRPLNKSWEDFYKDLSHHCNSKFSFRAFQNWYKGVSLPPLEIVETIVNLLNITNRLVEPKLLDYKIKPDNWGVNLGGLRTTINKNTFRRKVVGPRGEKMFNNLEKKVAEQLSKLKINYEYEKPINLNDAIIIPDFTINDSIIIECTEFTFLNYKVSRLKKRLQLLKEYAPMNSLLLVTNDSLKEVYSKYLPEISVITPEELKEWFTIES